MKVRKFQATKEKTILIALIVNTRILSYISGELGRVPGGPFKNRWANLVSKWCFEYYYSHSKAPGRLIQNIFVEYAAEEPDDESIKLVESFLESLSGDYSKLKEGMNEKWVLDKAAEFFNEIKLAKMADDVQMALEAHDLKRAQAVRDETQQVSFTKDGWLNPFTKDNISATIEGMEKTKPMIRWRGDLDRFLSEHFERDAFIAFAGPEKMGKSWWLQECAWLALNQGKKVLYYIIGDMSEKQAFRRLYSRATLRPRKPLKDPLKIPREIKMGPKDDKGVPTGEVSFLDEVRPAYSELDVIRAVEKLKMNSAQREFPLRMKCVGMNSISAGNIETDIQNLIRDGFVPDVVVVDYLDLLLAEPSSAKMEPRHQINATWGLCRRISTDYHLLFIGGTQAAARAYDQWLIRKKDFSEDKRKHAHVTGMLGINRTPAEKQKGIYRLNWIDLRDGIWTENQCVWTAGNLALGCPCMVSLLK